MQTDEVGAAIDRIVQHQFWPWWFALAYVQPRAVRHETVRGAVQTFLAFGGKDYAPSAAIGRVTHIIAGDENLDAAAERLLIAEFEERLTQPILSGRFSAWGSIERGAALQEIGAAHWVGAEVYSYKSSDLINRGWLGADVFLPEATREPITRFFDLHMQRVDVEALAVELDRDWPTVEAERDYVDFLGIEREARTVREGFWSPFVACAWVCSRTEQFTAAAQEYEARYLGGKRGEALGYACAAGWLVVGNLAGERYGMTFTQGLQAIRDAIGAKRLGAGTGEHMGIGGRRPIEAHEWGAMRLAFERYGISPLHGLCAVQWSSADVVAAFAPLPADVGLAQLSDAEEVSTMVVGQANAAAACPNWAKRKAKPTVASLFVFFEKAARHMPGGSDPRSQDELFGDYEAWLTKQQDSGLRRTQFREWWERYVDGWRIGSRQRFYLTET